MEHHAQALRRVAESLNLPAIRTLIREPSVREVYRISVEHGDTHAPASVATLIRRTTGDTSALARTAASIMLEVGFHGALGGKRLTYPMAEERYAAFIAGLQNAAFDKLADQPDLPFYGAEIWLVERGAGSFTKSVLIAPQTAVGAHAIIVALIRTQLPEVLRELK